MSSSAGGRPPASSIATCNAMPRPSGATPSSTARSPPTTRWGCTTPGAAPTRTCSCAGAPCRATASATRTGSTARGCGSKWRWRRRRALPPSATSRPTASPASSRNASSGCASTPRSRPNNRSASATGWTGTTPTTPCRMRITTPSGISCSAATRTAGSTAAPTRCPGARAAAPACRSTKSSPRVTRRSPTPRCTCACRWPTRKASRC